MASDDDLVSLGPWPLGVNNRESEHGIPAGALRATRDVTIKASGAITLRDGYDNLDTTATHSLWSDDQIDFMLAVRGSALVKITVGPTGALAFTTLRTGMADSNYPVSYVCVDGVVYYSNGLVTGKVVEGAHRAWGVERPATQPTCAASSSGGLHAGRYQVAITFTDDEGEESGAGSGVLVDVSESGGISVTAIPQPSSGDVDWINLYVTEANGEVFYRYAKLAVGTTSAAVSVSSTQGKRLRTQFMEPPPAGCLLEVHNGRIYGVHPDYPKFPWYTEALGYGHFRQGNRLAFEGAVTLMASVDAGMVVAADKTFFLTGTNPATFTPSVIFGYGSPQSSYVRNPDDNSIIWMSDEGFCSMTNSGQAANLTQARIAMKDGMQRAALAYHEADGVKQVIAASVGGADSDAQSSDYMGVTVTMRAAVRESIHVGSVMSATVS